MNRRLLGLALLVSVGVNLGVLFMVLRRPPPPPPPPVVASDPEPVPVAPPPTLEATEPRVTEPPPRPAEPERRPAPRPDPRPIEPTVRPREEPRPRPPAEPALDPRPLDQRPGVALRLDRLADELGLTGETRERFSRLQREFLHSAWALRAQMRNAEAEMRQELFAREPDRARIDEIQGRIDGLRRELDSKLLDTVLASRALLEPAQDVRYLQVVGRLRQAAMGAPTRDPATQRLGPGPGGEPRPFRRRPRNPRRPPG